MDGSQVGQAGWVLRRSGPGRIRLGTTVGFLGVWLLLQLLARAADTDPLPSADEVLRQIVAQAPREEENDRRFRRLYSYVRARTEIEKNGRGEEKRRTVKTSTNRVVAVRLAASASSAAISVANAANRAPNRNRKPERRAYEKSDFNLNDELLARYQFRVVAREPHDGRSTLVLDFAPRPGLKDQEIKDRFINRIGGRVWIDEAEFFLVQADFRLQEEVDVVGGLVGAVKSFTCHLERERTPEGYWFTRRLDWSLVGRQFMSRKILEGSDQRTQVVYVPAAGPAAEADRASIESTRRETEGDRDEPRE